MKEMKEWQEVYALIPIVLRLTIHDIAVAHQERDHIEHAHRTEKRDEQRHPRPVKCTVVCCWHLEKQEADKEAHHKS